MEEKMEDQKSEMLDTDEQSSQAEEPQVKPDEKFDEARAMELIQKLRGEIKGLKKSEAELERLREAEEERKQAEMSETERLKAENDRLQSELKAKTVRTMQIEAAAKAGIPAALSDRLKGETPEEMEEDAKAILELLPKTKTAPNTGTTNPGDKASKEETYAQKMERPMGGNTEIWKGGGINWGTETPQQ